MPEQGQAGGRSQCWLPRARARTLAAGRRLGGPAGGGLRRQPLPGHISPDSPSRQPSQPCSAAGAERAAGKAPAASRRSRAGGRRLPAARGGPPSRAGGVGGWAPRHGLHHAAPRGRPRALPRPQHPVRGRGEPERERHVGPVVRLLRGRRGPAQAAPQAGAHGDGEAAASGQRAGARPDAERQHGLHRPAHPHPHRARGSQAVQDRDPPPGLQLHLPPGQRAAAGRGLRGRAALLQCHLRGQGRPGQQAAPQHLHLLPQQPAQRGQPKGPWGQLPEGARGDPAASVTEMSRGPAAPT